MPAPADDALAPHAQDALAWLAGQRRAMEDLLAELVERSSFTRDPAGVAAVVERVEAELARAGLAAERIASARFGPHLAFRGAAPGAPVLLVGHTDTVFPPDHPFRGFRREGDRGVGPGAFDMKGGIAVLLFGLSAAARAGLLGRVAVAGMLVSDEEVGSPESQPLLRERARGAACALVFESGRAGDLVVTRRRGVGSLRAEAHGVAAHAGNEPEKGRSAIWALARLVDRVQALSDPARGRSVNVGTFHGGTTKNTVPEHAACEVDLRFETAADGRALSADVEAAAREAALPGTRIEVSPGAWRDPLERTAASAALAAEYGEAQRACGLGAGEAPLAGGGSDACTTGAARVPSIDGLGPRGDGFHTPDEHVDLSSLVPKAQALVRFLARRAARAG
ncbi:MAG TPA: M20 family metallopeptidase [Anaeromyxobacter sp.]|nr:M20 family metallopeptidase [Anaeromyxobacter sp.]